MLTSDEAAVRAKERTEEISVRELGEQAIKGTMGKVQRVRGVVVRVSAVYPAKEGGNLAYVYGDLRDELDGPEMAFQCRADRGVPRAGERAVLEGRVKVAFNKKIKRFELRLSGSRLRSWGKDVEVTELAQTVQRRASTLRRTEARVDLSRLFDATEGRVVLIGSERTMPDVESTARRLGSRTRFEKFATPVVTWKEMLRTAKAVAERCDAICLVRGGGREEDFACWDEREFVTGLLSLGKPFYVAVGHADYVERLADRLADQSFSTPSEFGGAYAREQERAQQFAVERAQFTSRLEQMRLSNERMQAERGPVEARLREASEREAKLRGRGKLLLKAIGVLSGLVALLMAWVIWR